MKSFDGLNYYEILQIPLGASYIEIKRAYRDALSIYEEDSLATYFLFSNDERDNILKMIEKAYSTLMDANKRSAYDKVVVESGQVNESIIRRDQKKAISSFISNNVSKKENLVDPISDQHSSVGSAYRQEIFQTIDMCRKKIELQRTDRQRIKNRFIFLQMREKLYKNRNLSGIEPELLAMLADLEKPSLQMRRNISIIIISYTLIAIASFILLTITDAIMLRSFNIPYSVLLMGLVGCLVSIYLKLPTIRSEQPLRYDLTVWVIISPPVAVIMAGIFFGIVQIFISVFQINLFDESWVFLILAWVVGFVNWVYFYERLRGGFINRGHNKQDSKTEIS